MPTEGRQAAKLLGPSLQQPLAGSGPNPETVKGETEGSKKGTLKKGKGLIFMRLRYWRDRAWSQGIDVLGALFQ